MSPAPPPIERVVGGSYPVVIADLVGSRALSKRALVQTDLALLVGYLDRTYGSEVLTRFTISRGDEFQVILRRADLLPDILWDCDLRFQHTKVRFGVGHGILNTSLSSLPTETDGPAWWRARDALERARSTKRNGGIFVGFGSHDELLTAMGALLEFVRSKLTLKQREVLHKLRLGSTLAEIGTESGIARQTAFRHAKAAGWGVYNEGEAAWKELLRHFHTSD